MAEAWETLRVDLAWVEVGLLSFGQWVTHKLIRVSCHSIFTHSHTGGYDGGFNGGVGGFGNQGSGFGGQGFGRMGGGGGRGGYGADFGDMGRGGNGGPGGCVVLLISNIPEELANVTNIFNMVGMYGDVVAVKILRNKTDCCLVQLAKPHHAQQVRVSSLF